MLPKLFLSLTKLSAQKIPEPAHQDFLDEHFSISPQWKAFLRHLRSKKFVAAVTQDDRADKKLQRFSENIGRHKQAKNVPIYSVPSQTTGKSYTVKYHPEIERYSCDCGDWTYARSWRKGQKTRDCKHVQMLQKELKAQGNG